MNTQDKNTIREMEKAINRKLNNQEMMSSLIAFRYGVIEGLNKSGKIMGFK